MNITELSIRRPVSTIMLFVSLVVIGLIAAFRLPLESQPETSAPFFFVSLPYQGSTPEEVEQNVVKPVEEALATMSGIKSLNATASANSGSIFVQFSDWGRNVAVAVSEARERIDAIRDQLPDDFRRYFVWRWNSGDEEAISLRLTSHDNLVARGELIDQTIKRRLERLPGVARIEVEGIPEQEIEVAIEPDRLNANGVVLDELVSRLQAANFSVSGGMITDDGRRLRIQPKGEMTDVEQLRALPINGRGVRLGDIAEVTNKPQRTTYVRQVDGRPSIGVDIFKERAANLVDLSRAVKTELESLRRDPAMRGINIEVTEDQGDQVINSLLALAEAGAIGLALSVFVLWYFLRHWPSVLMVSTAIPICFIMTLGFMYFFGITLNILSMMGLLLAVGMLVDNAVVVVESIYQEREKYPGQPRLASVIGTRHVAIALSAGTLCHCIVFLPMMFGEKNMLTIYLTQLAVTISVSLLASWLVAISLIPMLSARLQTPPALKSPFITRLQARYADVLRWTLEHRGWSVLGIFLIVAVSLVPITYTKGDSGDQGDPSEVAIFYQWNGSYSKEQMGEVIGAVERYINANRRQFDVKQVYSRYAEQGWAVTQIELNHSDSEQAQAIADRLRDGLPKSARANIGVGRQGGMGGGGSQDISFSLMGDSTQTLKEIANDVIPILSRSRSLRDVRVDTGDAGSELTVHVNRDRAAAYGFNAQQVAQFVGLALRGSSLREFHRGETEIPVNVRFRGVDHYGPENLQSFTVRAPDGRSVPLLAMVDVSETPSANSIQRMNRQTMLKVQASLAPGADMEQARKDIEATLNSLDLPPGYGYTFEGSGFGMNIDMNQQMMRNTLIAVALMFIVMASVFESLLFPLAIMSSVVFSILGVFWGLWLTGTQFNIMAFIGVLVLMGVVVNNGIVMIEHINNLRRRGLPRIEALIEGSRERLRPILMTMGTAILAMIPIAISNTQIAGDGPPYNPMARAIAGGLAFSTVVTLLFLPTIYALLDDLRSGTARIIARARGLDTAQPAPTGTAEAGASAG
ncbi:MAG: efflux RND transporter permease subunit [Thermomonas sp.]|uniref:efflux RND transporter permease subunit n=1 Tax=Thermomonas sp. TaxID=1971895 RepID=UPI00262B6B9A|nr:efflux RND transporter permease subunit [Thermomonas sp.]MCC7095931.1 efflux RND transporter permease subunit [Thermomonas sp.]